MIEFDIILTLNRPADIEIVEPLIKTLSVQAPVLIVEMSDSIRISFTADYDYYELNSAIERQFDNYELTTEVGNGRKEIRLQIHRYQSPFSTDVWGRRIEDPINETLYLIKKNNAKEIEFNPKVRVLFEDTERQYCINIVPGIRHSDQKKGFLLIDSFEDLHGRDIEKPIVQKLFSTTADAYWKGLGNLSAYVNEEFEAFKKAQKTSRRKKHK